MSDFVEAVLIVAAVLLIISAAAENWIWRWYTRLIRGSYKTPAGNRRLP